MNTSKNSTNKELIEEMGEIINDGKTRVYAKAPSSNPDYTTIFLVQSISTVRSTSSANEFFLGWNNKRLVRAIHNAKSDIASKIEIGKVVPFDILLTETVAPVYEGQQPKINPDSGEVIMFGDNAVYERTELVEQGKGGINPLVKEITANVVTTTENPVAATVKKTVEVF